MALQQMIDKENTNFFVQFLLGTNYFACIAFEDCPAPSGAKFVNREKPSAFVKHC